MNKGFDLKSILARVVAVLDEKIKSISNPNPQEKPRYSKTGFFTSKKASLGFPMSKDTYYGYTAYVNANKPVKHKATMRMDTFYDVCKYANVSADYLLGFISSKRKEESADMVKRNLVFPIGLWSDCKR